MSLNKLEKFRRLEADDWKRKGRATSQTQQRLWQARRSTFYTWKTGLKSLVHRLCWTSCGLWTPFISGREAATSTDKCRDANLWRSQIYSFFFGPPDHRPNSPIRSPSPKISFFHLDPLLNPLPTEQFCRKKVDLSVKDFEQLNTHLIRLSLI